MTTLDLDTYLKSRPDRCSGCGYADIQGCICAAMRAKAEGQSAALAGNPDDAAKVEAAIRRLMRLGIPFSANDARDIHGVKGGVVGATFTALKTRGVIKVVGDEISTDKGTHGKPVAMWIAA